MKMILWTRENQRWVLWKSDSKLENWQVRIVTDMEVDMKVPTDDVESWIGESFVGVINDYSTGHYVFGSFSFKGVAYFQQLMVSQKQHQSR